MDVLLQIPGDHFEFETRMLIKAEEEGIDILDIPVETIYGSKKNHSTHFRSIADSIRIYGFWGLVFGLYMLSNASSGVVNLLIFQFIYISLRKNTYSSQYVAMAAVVAKVISAAYNNTYLITFSCLSAGEVMQNPLLHICHLRFSRCC